MYGVAGRHCSHRNTLGLNQRSVVMSSLLIVVGSRLIQELANYIQMILCFATLAHFLLMCGMDIF